MANIGQRSYMQSQAVERPPASFKEKGMEDYFWELWQAHAKAYDAKMMFWAQTAETSSSTATIACRHEPTIADCLEEFKSRIARDELPGEG